MSRKFQDCILTRNTFLLIYIMIVSNCLFATHNDLDTVKTLSQKIISQKIINTISYFQRIGKCNLETDVQILLPYLENKFSIVVFDANSKCSLDSIPLLYNFIWLYQPRFNWSQFSASLKDTSENLLKLEYKKKSMDALTIYACLCNHLILPNDILFSIDDKIKMGNYELTHAALQYQNLYINNCISDELFLLKKTQIENRMLNDILLPNLEYYRAYDLKIEVAALLYYINSDLINNVQVRNEITTLMQYQMDSGGWKAGPGYKEQQHTSLLALWLLLEMNNTN